MQIKVDENIYLLTPSLNDALAIYNLETEDRNELKNIFSFITDEYSIDDEIEFIKSLENDKYLFYIFYDHQVCGKLGLYDLVEKENAMSIYYYVSSKYRRKHIAEKSIQTILNHAFNNLGLKKILFYVNDNNRPSLNLVSKFNIRYVSYLKDKDLINGKYFSQHLYMMTEDLFYKGGKETNLELFDCYDENENKLGFDLIRGKTITKGCYHIVVEIFTINELGEILMTKRHPNKHYPLCWEMTGGSVLKGETVTQGAVRELKEETGIIIKESDLNLFYKFTKNTELYRGFITFINMNNQKISLQDEETVDYQFISLREFNKFIMNNDFVNTTKERYLAFKDEFNKTYYSHFFQNTIMKVENNFPMNFTHYLEKEYGIIFYNEENKISHDSNHAIIYMDKITNLENVLKKVKSFYLEKGLSPRIYQTIDGSFEKNKKVFEEAGYQLISFGTGVNKVYLQCENSTIKSENRLKLYRLDKYDNRILTDIFKPDDASFDAIVIEKAIENPNFHLIIGELNGEFVTCASIYYSNGVARLDHVATAPKHRRKGYCQELISFLVFYHQKASDFVLYEWPANEVAERIYKNAGFRYVFSIENTVAFIEHNDNCE